MIKPKLVNDAKKYYAQCYEAYKSKINNDTENTISVPPFYQDDFNVPLRFLYSVACKTNDAWCALYDELKLRVLKTIKYANSSEVDIEDLLKLDNVNAMQKYSVYLELCANRIDSIPAIDSIISLIGKYSDVKASKCGVATLEDVYSRFRQKLYNPKQTFVDGGYTLLRSMGSSVDKVVDGCVAGIKIELLARSTNNAADRAVESILLVEDIINTANAMSINRVHLFDASGGKSVKIECVCDTGFVLVDSGDCVAVYGTRRYDKSIPHDIYNSYRSDKYVSELTDVILGNRVLADRLKKIVSEYATASSSTNPDTKILGYWRCLEIATKKSNEETRRESDIVKIVRVCGENKTNRKWWGEMCELVMQSRNTCVHQGAEVDDLLIYWAKLSAEAMIRKLLELNSSSSIKNSKKNIDYYFDHIVESDESLRIAWEIYSDRQGL